MTLPNDGLILVVKRDCPTCRLIEPLARELVERGLLAGLYSQDDPDFPAQLEPTDDRHLEASYRLNIDIVPTLVRREDGRETDRAIGWHRGEWQNLTGLKELGAGLPNERPGCGSLSAAPGMDEALQARFGATGLSARKFSVEFPEDEVEQMFDRGWTDGLPVVPPTPARVLRMLAGSGRAPDEIVGQIPPAFDDCTVEKVAINMVMAGCRPEYMPIVLSALDAALDPDFAWSGLLSTTMGAGLTVIVNGPIANRVGMNWGMGALGHGNRANSTIARALQLIAINVGGAQPGGVDRTTIGHPGKYGLAFAEDETDGAWEPLAVSRGIATGSSAVTLFANCGTASYCDELSRDAHSLKRSLAACLLNIYHPKSVGDIDAMLVLGSEHWQVFKAQGWGRADITAALHDATRRPGADLVRGVGGIGTGIEPEQADSDVAKFREDGLSLVRAGGRAGLFSTIICGWSGGAFGSRMQTREVKS